MRQGPVESFRAGGSAGHNDKHGEALQDFSSRCRPLTYNPGHGVSSGSPSWVEILDQEPDGLDRVSALSGGVAEAKADNLALRLEVGEMPDLAQGYPLEDQWGLLVEHRIECLFHGLWVESGNVDEVSALLRVDPDSRQECSLETATEAFRTSSGETVWMGAHSAGWTHILARGLYPYHPAIRNLGKRRVLEIRYNDHLKELEPVNLYYDGEQVGDITPPYEEGGDMDLPDYRPYASGIALGDSLDLSRCVHLMLCMVGRITGRFLDREWATSTRALYRIPGGTWQESW